MQLSGPGLECSLAMYISPTVLIALMCRHASTDHECSASVWRGPTLGASGWMVRRRCSWAEIAASKPRGVFMPGTMYRWNSDPKYQRFMKRTSSHVFRRSWVAASFTEYLPRRSSGLPVNGRFTRHSELALAKRPAVLLDAAGNKVCWLLDASCH